MTDQRHRPGPPGSKPGPSAGISPTEFQALRTKVSDLERQLQEALAERNQWNSVLRRWQDKEAHVKFKLQGGEEVSGRIAFIDRYTIGILTLNVPNEEPVIVHKGAIATVRV